MAYQLQPEEDGNGVREAHPCRDLWDDDWHRNGMLSCEPECIRVKARQVTRGPEEDARFAETQHPRRPLRQRWNLQTQSCRSLGDPVGHRLDPLAISGEAAIVLADQGCQARREQI